MENILVALSNFPAVCPILLSYYKKDYTTCTLIIFVTLASFFSHLTENHKHGMSGIGFSEKQSYFMNRLDVTACALVSIRFLYLYYKKYGHDINILLKNKKIIFLYLVPLLFLIISEFDKYNVTLKNRYIITHIIWHLSVFMVLDDFLSRFVYS